MGVCVCVCVCARVCVCVCGERAPAWLMQRNACLISPRPKYVLRRGDVSFNDGVCFSEADRDLKAVLAELERTWLGAWRGLLLGAPAEEERRAEVRRAGGKLCAALREDGERVSLDEMEVCVCVCVCVCARARRLSACA